MSRQPSSPLLVAVLVVACVQGGGCSSLSTNVTIKQKVLPGSFGGDASGPSIAEISWREYFSDPHLNALITEALENSHDLSIALQRIEIARAGVKQATGALLPQVALSLGAGARKFGLYTMDGAGNATTDITPGERVPVMLGDFSIGLQTSWEIDIWGKLRNQRKSMLAQYLATVEGTNLVVTSLVSDLASAYYELLAIDHADVLLRRAIERQQHALEVVRLQKLAGRANELAVQQFEAQLADTQAAKVALEQQQIEAANRINLLLGRYPQPVAREKDALFAGIPYRISSGIPSELLRNRPDIREAEQRVEATNFDLRAAKAAFFPSLTLGIGIGYQAFNPAYLFRSPESLVGSVLAGIVAPMFNWSALRAQFSAAKATQTQAMYSYQKTIVSAFIEVTNGLSELQKTESILGFKKKRQAAMAQTVEMADTLFRAGRATYLEVLVVQQTSLQTDLELIEAWKKQHLVQVAVYKALGGGWR